MANQHAPTSLISLCAAVLIAAIHHVLELGPRGAVIAFIFIPVACGVLFGFKRSQSRAALVVYALLNVWMVVGFGLLHGFLEHTIPLLALSHSTATLDLTTLMRHLSGFAMAVAAVWVGVAGWRFLSAAADAPTEAAAAIKRLPLLPAIASAALLTTVVGAYTYFDAQWLRIAIIAPVTGPNAVLAQSFIRAAEMAKEDLGADADRIQLMIVDSTGTPAQTRNIIDQIFAARRIDAVLGAVSASGQFTAPHASRTRIPHICVCSVRTIGDGQYNFTNIPLPEDEAMRWVAEAKRRGVTTIAILAQGNCSPLCVSLTRRAGIERGARG